MQNEAKSLLILIDGLGDEPNSKIGGLTPLEFAATPYIDRLAAQGVVGQASICEQELIPESCSCILRLLGLPTEAMPKNRAYLELLAHNRDVAPDEMVLRCNLAVRDNNGRLVAFNGSGLTTGQMKQAAMVCNKLYDDIEFFHLSEYRNLLILKQEEAVLNCRVQPPHESLGESVDQLLAELKQSSSALAKLLEEAEKRLSVFNHDGLHYILYPWGASDRQALPSFTSLNGKSGGAVCKAEIVVGIAKALGMEVITPPTATGDIDTVVSDKVEAALELLKQHDFVIAHFNGSDEAAHRYDALGKAQFIAKIDQEFLGLFMRVYDNPLKIVVCGDHVTSSVNGKHGDGPVPIIAGAINMEIEGLKISSYKDILSFLLK